MPSIQIALRLVLAQQRYSRELSPTETRNEVQGLSQVVQECGIPEEQAMRISGHRTHEMLKRCNSVSLNGVLDSGDKMDAWMKKSRREQVKSKPVFPGAAEIPPTPS